MYTIHTTPGFIISSRPYGEAGKMLQIFTRDLGLVLAAAPGIRFEKSKLRYHTKDYSFGTFSLVRGKEFWRLVNAQEHEVRSTETEEIDSRIISKAHFFLLRTADFGLPVRLAVLLRRLLQGEESHPELFDCLEATMNMSREISVERLPELESLTALRILNLLGYIGDSEVIRPFVTSQSISEEILADLSQLRPKVNGIINASLQASHL
jgi:hypothetical protein